MVQVYHDAPEFRSPGGTELKITKHKLLHAEINEMSNVTHRLRMLRNRIDGGGKVREDTDLDNTSPSPPSNPTMLEVLENGSHVLQNIRDDQYKILDAITELLFDYTEITNEGLQSDGPCYITESEEGPRNYTSARLRTLR